MYLNTTRRFHDCLFAVDLEDRKKKSRRISNFCRIKLRYLVEKLDFLFERVKRYIPYPEKLLPVVKLLFEKYGRLICARTGLPLFDDKAYKRADQILRSIELGHISDIENGPPLYNEKGLDKNGLMQYRYSRGTNSVEGSVHTNII